LSRAAKTSYECVEKQRLDDQVSALQADIAELEVQIAQRSAIKQQAMSQAAHDTRAAEIKANIRKLAEFSASGEISSLNLAEMPMAEFAALEVHHRSPSATADDQGAAAAKARKALEAVLCDADEDAIDDASRVRNKAQDALEAALFDADGVDGDNGTQQKDKARAALEFALLDGEEQRVKARTALESALLDDEEGKEDLRYAAQGALEEALLGEDGSQLGEHDPQLISRAQGALETALIRDVTSDSTLSDSAASGQSKRSGKKKGKLKSTLAEGETVEQEEKPEKEQGQISQPVTEYSTGGFEPEDEEDADDEFDEDFEDEDDEEDEDEDEYISDEEESQPGKSEEVKKPEGHVSDLPAEVDDVRPDAATGISNRPFQITTTVSDVDAQSGVDMSSTQGTVSQPFPSGAAEERSATDDPDSLQPRGRKLNRSRDNSLSPPSRSRSARNDPESYEGKLIRDVSIEDELTSLAGLGSESARLRLSAGTGTSPRADLPGSQAQAAEDGKPAVTTKRPPRQRNV
jgi:hypothetical protein